MSVVIGAKRLHLGCAKKRLEGWLNVDIDPHSMVDLVCDVSNLSEFGDGTVDEIYACHILEHFGRARVIPVLCEWNRVLKVGGTLRIAVPDFESCMKIYLKNPADLFLVTGLLHGGQQNQYDYHHIAFDLLNMTETLKHCGFQDTQRYDPDKFLPVGFDDFSLAYLPHNDRKGLSMSLNVTAKKNIYINKPPLDTFLTNLIGKKLIPNAIKQGHISTSSTPSEQVIPLPTTTTVARPENLSTVQTRVLRRRATTTTQATVPSVIESPLPVSWKVMKCVATGFGDRLSACLMYSAAVYAATPSNAVVYMPWDNMVRAWGPTCLHGGWPNDLKGIQKCVSFPQNVILTDEKTVLLLPSSVQELKQNSVLVGSILPTVGWTLFPSQLKIDGDTFYKAYRRACAEMIITHPITKTLPKHMAVVHIRGGDKQDRDPKFLEITMNTINQLKKMIVDPKQWRLVTDDLELAKQIPALDDVPPLPAAEPGLEATLRDFAVLTHASVIVQHSPNGWSAFSHIASCLREIPIINTCPGPEHADFMLRFFQGKSAPPYFFNHSQAPDIIKTIQHLPWFN